MKRANKPTPQDHSLYGYIERLTTRELEFLLQAYTEDQPFHIEIVRDVLKKRRKE